MHYRLIEPRPHPPAEAPDAVQRAVGLLLWLVLVIVCCWIAP